MPVKNGLELVHIELKRDSWAFPERKISNDKDAVRAMRDLICDMDREMLVCINMAASGRVINASICSIGTIDSALVFPPEIMRGVLLSGARSMIIMHNHPSGSCRPSNEDRSVTKRMATVSYLMGVKMLDSIIVGEREENYSFLRDDPDYLEPAPLSVNCGSISEVQPVYTVESETTEERPDIRETFVTQHRRQVVEKIISLMEDGVSFSDPMWSSAAMRPCNPVSGAIYRGANRLILMQEAMFNRYQDPRWMTFKQLSSKGYHVRSGEHGVKLEKWIFTERKKKEGPDGKVLKGADGKPVYEEVLLPRPKCSMFYVFNGEQIEDFPKYEPKVLLEGEIGERIEALLSSSECPIHEVAQDRSFYRPATDEIYLPLRSAFRDQNAFCSVAAHEMVHSTGHYTRLARDFGSRDAFGYPDDKYCMEELKAELGSVFLMNDIGVPAGERDMGEAADYLNGYIHALRENPNILFKIAAEASKAEDRLFKNFQKVYELKPEVEIVKDNERSASKEQEMNGVQNEEVKIAL